MKLARYRNLFNGDCTFLFGDWSQSGTRSKPFDIAVIHRFIDLLAQSGVDTYLQSPNAQVPWYPSRVLPHVLTGYSRGDREYVRGQFPPVHDTDFPAAMLEKRVDEMVLFLNCYLDLQDAGIDWVEEIFKACRRNKISPWVSVRMNDAHGANSWEKSFFNCDLQKQERFRLSGKKLNPQEGFDPFLQLLNYEHPEVRDYYFSMIRELVEDYDCEGLELDWTRTPACCEPEATQKTCAMMTEWIAQIRALCNAQSQKNGKPFPLGLRVPVRLDQLQTIGLDVPMMARENLIDFLCPSNTWQTTWDVPHEEIKKQAGKSVGESVAIYGVVEDAPNWMDARSPRFNRSGYRLLSTSPPLLRGNAAGKLASGAHGIETFNFFCSDENHHNPEAGAQQAEYSCLRDLHDLEKLRGQSKHYCFASQSGYFLNQVFEYGEQIPFVLPPQRRRALRLTMSAEPESTLALTIQVIVEKQQTPPKLGISFNGSWFNFDSKPTDELVFPTGIYTHHVPKHCAFNFQFEANKIKEGWNEILVFNGAQASDAPPAEYSVYVTGVELAVHENVA